jgi:hypothetical protein
MLRRISALSAGKSTTKFGFSARDTKIGDMKTAGDFYFCDICADELVGCG